MHQRRRLERVPLDCSASRAPASARNSSYASGSSVRTAVESPSAARCSNIVTGLLGALLTSVLPDSPP